MSDLKEIRYIKKIEELQKKVTDLHKYKNFVELEKNSKQFFQKFEKINKNNLILIDHIKSQKNTIELLIRERDEYKKKLNKLKDDGLTFVNKKKFYELNLKINELEKSNEELKNIIKNKENLFLDLNVQITDLKQQNNQFNILMNSFIHDYNNLNKTEIIDEIKDNKSKTEAQSDTSKNNYTNKKGYKSANENSESNQNSELEEIDDIDDLELDDDILL